MEGENKIYFRYWIYVYQKLGMNKTKPGKKHFAKISSLALVMAKKPLKNVLLHKQAIFDGFLPITWAREDIYTKLSLLSNIKRQLVTVFVKEIKK